MRRPEDTARSAAIVSRRALIVGAVQLGVVGALGLRMRSMQVEQADVFRNLAEENRVNIRLVPPARGVIFDRAGKVLADNEQNFRVVMVREEAGDVEAVLARLAELMPLNAEALEAARAEFARLPAFVPVTIADRLNWDDFSRVNVNAPALPGVTAEVGLSRAYPEGDTTAHVVGYVGPVSDYDLTRGYLVGDSDPLLKIPRFQVGKTGVEARMEHDLRGTAGTRRVEVNALGREMRELGLDPGQSGTDLQLTLDSELQAYIHARVEGQSASVVVIDVETGDLRACASSPTFDPNLFVRGISVADYNLLVEKDTASKERQRPLASKAVQDAYPPGSTFKMVTALAALEAGEIGPEETVYCPGHLDVSDIRFHCWKRAGHGNIDLHESLKQSCDVYYYDIAQRVGIDKIAEMARRLGLGTKHAVPMSAVATGIAPDKAWKRAARDEDWRIGDTVNASIGQGYVLASPLQLAVMAARLATGRDVTPRLVQGAGGLALPRPEQQSLGINENHLRRVRASMFDVSNHRRGTAYRNRIAETALKMAGKTGTSQVRRITAEERARGVTRNEDLPWHRRDHALFVSFAPFDAPKYALSVVVEHGGGGSSAAAPIARDVMLQALYDGPPPLTAYPSADRTRIKRQQDEIAARLAARARARSRA